MGLFSLAACLSLGAQEGSGGGAGEGGGGGTGGSAGSGGAGGGGGCSDGTCSWGRRFGGVEDQEVYDIALAGDGSVFVAGIYNGTISLGANVAVADTVAGVDFPYKGGQPYLAKLDAYGNAQWIEHPNGLAAMEGNTTAILVAGNLVVSTGAVLTTPTQRDIFVQIQQADAHPSSAVTVLLGGPVSDDDGAGVAVSSDGTTVYVAGSVAGNETTFKGCAGVAPFDTKGQGNLFIAALEATSGQCKWGRVYGGGHHIAGSMSLALGKDGHPIVSAAYQDGAITDTSIPPGPGTFVVKVNQADGSILGARGIPAVSPLGMAVDGTSGRVLVAGGQTQAMTFDGIAFPSPVAPDFSHALVLAFEPDLTESWARVFAGVETQFITDIATDNAGQIYVTGVSIGSLTVDGNTTLSCPGTDLCEFLLKLSGNDGAPIASAARMFGGQPVAPGPAPMVAVGAGALVLGTSWRNSITLVDGTPLEPTGSGADLDIVLSKVFPAP